MVSCVFSFFFERGGGCVSARAPLARYLWGNIESSIGDVEIPYH